MGQEGKGDQGLQYNLLSVLQVYLFVIAFKGSVFALIEINIFAMAVFYERFQVVLFDGRGNVFGIGEGGGN